MSNALLYRRLEGPKSCDDLIEIWRDENGWVAKSSIPNATPEISRAIKSLIDALNMSGL